jgi:hypothetical protein
MARQETAWDDVTNWPSLSDAAGMLRLHRATLSRQVQRGNIAAQAVGLGHGKRLVSPAEVLRLGQLYRRVPQGVLEQDLARYVAERTPPAARCSEHGSAVARAGTDAAETSLPADGTAQSGMPSWMWEFNRLLAQSPLPPDTEPFITADHEQDWAYAGSYREADEVTLIELTGLDPAVYRS